MTILELQNKLINFSTSYFLTDLRKEREEFYALTPQQMDEFPICKTGYILNLFMEGKLDQANKIISKMPEHDYVRLALNIVNPTIRWRDFCKTLQYFKETGQAMQCLVLTAGRPYLINGYNDFTRTTPFLEKDKQLFLEALDLLYGKNNSTLLYNLILAENYYQKNKLTDSELLLSQIIKGLEKREEHRFVFSSLYLEARTFIANGIKVSTDKLIQNIENSVTQTGKAEFSNNIEAVRIEFLLYENKYDEISQWLTTDAPDEFLDFNMLDLYRYMIKIHCYILTEQYNFAISLIEKLRPLLHQGNRYTDLCELDILLAITLNATEKKDLAMEALERALKIARRRGFLRLIADEGAAIFPILLQYIKIHGQSDFLLSLVEPTRKMAVLYPQYLQPRYKNNEQFTPYEIEILGVLQQGKSLEEIGEYFFISVNTVKYHLKKIYEKLDARNAVEAIWNARKLKLIN